MKILLSAGHNPFSPNLDNGAVGQGQYEANDNIAIAKRVNQYLTKWGIETVYMPDNVGDLSAEQRWANANFPFGSGYAIQIHRNAGGGTGNEVWTTAFQNQIPLATSILKAMTEITKLPSRGVRDINNYSPLGWITGVNAESVLIEARFIDRDSITDADDMLDAYAIACGIADFLKVPRGKSVEQEALDAAVAAQAAAKAEADRLAALAEKARVEAVEAAEKQRLADEASKKAAEEKLAADKALKDEINQENLNILQLILLSLKNIMTAIMSKKG